MPDFHCPKIWLAFSLLTWNSVLFSQFETDLEIQEYQDESLFFTETIKINELTAEQLSAHPLIGPERALNIIHHRSSHGPILEMEELLFCGFQPAILRKLKGQILFHELTFLKPSITQRLLWKGPSTLNYRLSGRAETLKFGKHSWLIEYDTSSQRPAIKSWSSEFKIKQIRAYIGHVMIQENQGLIASPPFPVGKLFNLGSWSYQSVNISRYGGSQPAPLGLGVQIPWRKKLTLNVFTSLDGRSFASFSFKKLPIDIQWISTYAGQNHAHQLSLMKSSFLGIRWNLQCALDDKLNSAYYFSALGSFNTQLQWGLRYQRISSGYFSPFFSPFKKSEIGKHLLSWGIDSKIDKHTHLQFRYHLYESLSDHLPLHRRSQQEIWTLKTEYSKGASNSIIKVAQTLNQMQLSLQNTWEINDRTLVKFAFLAVKSEVLGTSNWISTQIETSMGIFKVRAQILTYQAPLLRIYAAQSLIYQPVGVISFKGSGHFYNLQLSARLSRHWKLQFQYILLHKTQISDAATPEIPRIFVQLTQQ
jgi:hypothetical protein